MYWNKKEGQTSGRNVLETWTSGALTRSIRLHLKRTQVSSGIGRIYWYAGLWKKVDSKTSNIPLFPGDAPNVFFSPIVCQWLNEEAWGRNVIMRGASCYYYMIAQVRKTSHISSAVSKLNAFYSSPIVAFIFYVTHLTLYGLQYSNC